MADDVATIAELRAKLAEEERKRLTAEERQRAAEEKQRVAEETLDVATRRTTLREYLDLYQSLCASELLHRRHPLNIAKKMQEPTL
jgi:hypothetical protein